MHHRIVHESYSREKGKDVISLENKAFIVCLKRNVAFDIKEEIEEFLERGSNYQKMIKLKNTFNLEGHNFGDGHDEIVAFFKMTSAERSKNYDVPKWSLH